MLVGGLAKENAVVVLPRTKGDSRLCLRRKLHGVSMLATPFWEGRHAGEAAPEFQNTPLGMS
jgi:hypothetical protein